MRTASRQSAWMVGVAAMVGVALIFCAGCANSKKKESEEPKETPAEAAAREEADREARKTVPVEGTIGSVAHFEGVRTLFVEGYGLVGGLAGTGSADCPEPLRQSLIEMLTKEQKRRKKMRHDEGPSASELIASKDTAVVRVTGSIPAGAAGKEAFDLRVTALPNSGTTSLEGGWLYTCELRVSGGPASYGAKSKVMAYAAGPVFVNPFDKKTTTAPAKAKAALKSLPMRREGYVLGGGTVVEGRRMSLVLSMPSYKTSRAIEQRINTVFPPSEYDPTIRRAKAATSAKVEVTIPEEYMHRKPYFLGMLLSIPIQINPNYLDRRAREMTTEVVDSFSNAESISFAWETMGKRILPLLQPMYSGENLQAAFYSARAGAAMGDSLAIARLGQFAVAKGPYQRRAIEQLTYCREFSARKILQEVLDFPDVELRVLAYEGLVRMNDASVSVEVVGTDNFCVDRVAARRWPMVYVTRANEAKIVLFGEMKIVPPVFYSHGDSGLMITADAGSDVISIVKRLADGGTTGRVMCGLELGTFLRLLGNDMKIQREQYTGLGVPYSQLVAILSAMCNDGSVDARFKVQDVALPAEPRDFTLGRPEKEGE